MIEPITRTHGLVNDEPLPPAWLRRAQTEPDDDSTSLRGIHRIGRHQRFRHALVKTIDEAREVVMVASFLLADEDLAAALLRAVDRGVRVYALTSTEAKLAQLPREDSEFDARMIAEHKALLDRLAGRVLLRSAGHFHAKFLVADPKTHPKGFVSTANFNRALLDSVELGVELNRKASQALAAWFSWVFWTEAERELVEKGRLAAVKRPPATPRLPTDLATIVPTTKSHHLLGDAALRLIEGAERQLVVASYSLGADHPSVDALIARARAGVEVTVLTRPRPAVLAAVLRLAEAGVTVLAHDKLHAKAIHSDAGALIMTANLETHGLDAGFETGVLLSGRPTARGTQASALKAILDAWIATFPWRFAPAVRPEEHLGEVWLADKGARDTRVEVVETIDVKLRSIIAKDALDLDAAPSPKNFRRPRDSAKIPRRVLYSWKVEPPRLPAKAVPEERTETREEAGKDGKTKQVKVKIPYNPPVYRVGKIRYVLLREPRDVEPARKLAAKLRATVVVK